MATVSLKNATLTIKDSANHSVVVKFGDGNITWKVAKEFEYRKDRGKLDTVREGDDVPLEVTVNSEFEKIIGGANSVYQILTGQGTYAGNGTSTDVCEPYCSDMYLQLDPECNAGGSQAEQVLFPQFRVEGFDFDVKGGTLNFSGKCNVVEPTISAVSPTGSSGSASSSASA